MENLLKLFFQIGKLKNLKRRGWVLRKIPNPESVADHSFRTAVITLLLSEKLDLDKTKCVKMALIHDLCETITGDIIPQDNITKEKQLKKEKAAMDSLFKDISGKEIIKLWDEYRKRKTPESRFVHEMDKFEFLLQGIEYKQTHKDKNIGLDKFFSSVEKEVKNKEILDIINLLKEKYL